MKLFLLVLLAVPASAESLAEGEVGRSREWFRATFEGDVKVGIRAQGGGCGDPPGKQDCWYWQVSGQDASGFEWKSDLQDGELACTNVKGETLVGSDKTSSDYFEVELQDKGGEQGNVLYMAMKANDTDSTAAKSRIQYHCNTTSLTRGYLAYDLWLQSDLQSQSCAIDFCWRYLWEIWESGSDFRLRSVLNRVKDGADVWQWQISGQDAPFGLGDNVVWSRTYTAGPPPAGQWIRYEAEWYLHETAGYVKLWIDGTKILEAVDVKTKKDSDPRFIDIMMIYTNSYIDDNKNPSPSWQYVDNVVICEQRDCP